MGATIEQTECPRIYVACLAAYNSGILHGAWIDAAQDPWDIWQGVRAMLAASPVAGAEEHAIHDYEGFGEVQLHESEGFEEVSQLARFVRGHGALGAALLSHFSGDLEGARGALEDGYLGCFDSLAGYVQELAEETNEIPERFRYYIDWESIAHDAELSGDLFTIRTSHDEVHVFAGR